MLETLITARPDANWYLVLDGGSLEGLAEPLAAAGSGMSGCLLPGRIDADVARVAPYVAQAVPASALVRWVAQHLALPWGYLVRSPLSLPVLRRHLRGHAQVRGPDGAPLWFRFWDPRVFDRMDGLVEPAQLAGFMRGIEAVYRVGAPAGGCDCVTWDPIRQCLARAAALPPAGSPPA